MLFYNCCKFFSLKQDYFRFIYIMCYLKLSLFFAIILYVEILFYHIYKFYNNNKFYNLQWTLFYRFCLYSKLVVIVFTTSFLSLCPTTCSKKSKTREFVPEVCICLRPTPNISIEIDASFVFSSIYLIFLRSTQKTQQSVLYFIIYSRIFAT